MRLNEIEPSDIENKKIIRIFRKYFTGIKRNNVSINNNLISVNESVRLYSKLDKLPVKFDKISGSFWCDGAGLISLEGSPIEVRGEFNCAGNRLTSLIDSPKNVELDFLCFNNPLQSLDGLPNHIGRNFLITYSPNLPLLKLLFVKGLNRVLFVKTIGDNYLDRTNLDNTELSNLMKKYLGTGRAGALQCAAELTKIGCKGNARL